MVEVKIRLRNYRLYLKLEHKITVIMGNSATGKSSIHRVINSKIENKYVKILNNKFSFNHIVSEDNLKDIIVNGAFKQNRIYIIDEGSIDITDEIAKAIQNTINSYFVITARTDLSNINFDIKACKTLETQTDGITILKDFIQTSRLNLDIVKNTEINKAIIEDSGKAKKWFEEIFRTADINVIVAGECKDEINSGGKEKVCKELEYQLRNNNSNILAIFDSVSFGCCTKEFRDIIEKYEDRVKILSNYKSWEYLMLNSKIYKDKYKEYDVGIPKFEEGYYEDELDRLSNINRYTHVKHDNGDLSKCYTEPCCKYTITDKEVCSVGLKGNDKFIALLYDTLFEEILYIARRLT